MKFKTIIADVPAPFRVWSKETGMGRSAESHYTTMSWQSLNELGPLVREVADDDCALFLWVVYSRPSGAHCARRAADRGR